MRLATLAVAQAGDVSYGLDGTAIRAFIGLLCVLGLIALLAYLLRRGVISIPGQRASRALSVETTLPLGERRSLAIVVVDGRRLLLGLSASQVSLVTELGAPRAFDQALDRASGPPPVRPS